MATPGDVFEALLRWLREDPQRRAALRSLVFEEFDPWERVVRAEEETRLALRGLAEAQARTEANLATLTARVDALTARVDTLTEGLATLTARVDTLTEGLATLTARVDTLTEGLATLTQRVEILATRVGDLDGESVERRYRDRPFAYLWRIALGLEGLSSKDLDELLDEVARAGGLTDGEEADVRLSDALLKGRRRDGSEVVLVLEAAARLDAEDVERVIRRSAILARGRRPVVPVVAGRQADPDLAEAARRRGVWVVIDGRTLEPIGA